MKDETAGVAIEGFIRLKLNSYLVDGNRIKRERK